MRNKRVKGQFRDGKLLLGTLPELFPSCSLSPLLRQFVLFFLATKLLDLGHHRNPITGASLALAATTTSNAMAKSAATPPSAEFVQDHQQHYQTALNNIGAALGAEQQQQGGAEDDDESANLRE